MTRELINAADILGVPNVQKAISNTATTDDEMGQLQERAVTAISMAMSLEIENDHPLSDKALHGIAEGAVSTLDAEVAALAGYQQMVSWFGPAGVPDHLPNTWEKAWNKKDESAPVIVRHGPEITPQIGAKLQGNAQAVALADQAVMDAEEVLRDLGRLDAAMFFTTVGNSMLVQVFEKIKKQKAYKKIPIRDEAGNIRLSENLDEFCQAKLGKSYSRLQELSSNMRTLGSDLYESAECIGFRARDYRALKALPPEDQDAIKNALAEDATKDQAIDLLQDMAERHAAEKAASKKETADLKADLEARDTLMADKTERVDKLSMELEKLKSLPPAERQRLWLEQEAAAAERLSMAEVKALGAVNEFLGEIADVLEADGISIPTSEYAHNIARFWAEGVGNLFANYGIAVDFEGIIRPEWTRTQAAEALGVED